MKKIACILGITMGLVMPVYKSMGQITLTQADMPKAGLVIDTYTDNTPTVLPGTAGTNKTWDFSNLQTGSPSTIIFRAASATPWAAHFTSANLADSTVGINGYNYLSSTADSLVITGGMPVVVGFQLIVNFKPAIRQFSLPTTYSDKDGRTVIGTSLAVAYTVPGVDSAKGKTVVTYADTMDAWGTIQMPDGISYNVLRQKYYELDIDSVFFYSSLTTPHWQYGNYKVTDTSYMYNWYANGVGYVVAQMKTDHTYKNVQSVSWYPGPTGINELTHNIYALVYPNPCTSQINFRYSTNAAMNLSVFDVAGRQISETTMKNGSVSLNTSAYSSGIYFYKLTDVAGALVDQGKFSVH